MENKTVIRSDFDQFMVPNYAPMSFIPVRGEGSRIWDQQGQERGGGSGGLERRQGGRGVQESIGSHAWCERAVI